MKRPFAVVGITYLIAQTIAVLCGLAVTTALFCMTLLCALVVFVLVRECPAWLIPALLSCLVCFGMSCGHRMLVVRPAQALEGNTVLLSGRVCEAPYESFGRYYYIIETDRILRDDMPQTVRFRLSSSRDLDIVYGDGIYTEVSFSSREENSAAARSLRADGVMLTGYLPYNAMTEIAEGSPSLYGWIIELRNSFGTAASRLMGDELGGLLTGMFTGDTSGIDKLTLARFRDCGLSHLFSVSGLHLSILTAALIVLLRRLTPNYRATALMCLPFVLFFMAFSGFSMSIRRAGIMMVLSLAAAVVRREYDPLNSLGFAALVICLLNPCAAGDAGMLMSFASTAGIVILYTPVSRRLRAMVRFDPKSRTAFVVRPVLETIATSVIAQVFTVPISTLCFGEMSLTAPFANVICIYPAAIFMMIGALATAVSCVPFVGMIVGYILMLPAWVAGKFCLVVTRLIALIPGSGLSVNYPFMGIFVAGAIVLFCVWYVNFGREKGRGYSLGLSCALALEVLLFSVALYNGSAMLSGKITVFGSDSGIMTALTSGRQCVVIGCGTDSYRGWLASERLSEDNITDLLAVALPDSSAHYAEYACEMIEQYSPEAVFLSDEGSSYELILQSCGRVDADMYHARSAFYSAEGCDISFRIFEDKNDMMWTWAECSGISMLICPEMGDCLLLPDEYLRPDVALMSAGGVVNTTVLDPLAIVVTAAGDQEICRAASLLEYRGMENVFAVPEDGCVVVERAGSGVEIAVE